MGFPIIDCFCDESFSLFDFSAGEPRWDKITMRISGNFYWRKFSDVFLDVRFLIESRYAIDNISFDLNCHRSAFQFYSIELLLRRHISEILRFFMRGFSDMDIENSKMTIKYTK